MSAAGLQLYAPACYNIIYLFKLYMRGSFLIENALATKNKRGTMLRGWRTVSCQAMAHALLHKRMRARHYYRMDLVSRTVTAFSPGYRAGTTIPGLKVEPSVPGHRAGTKEMTRD